MPRPPLPFSPTKAGLLAAVLLGSLAPLAARAQADFEARDLAASCTGCHGTGGRARGDMRPLAGLPGERIVAALAAFKAGVQPATVMQQIAKGYTDEQIRLLAGYFAAQPALP